MSHLPIGWVFSAFCVAVLGWVIRGIAAPVAKFLKEDREHARKHGLDQRKFEVRLEMLGKRLRFPAPKKSKAAERVKRS